MSQCVALQARLASVLQALIHTVVAEMCKLLQERSEFILNLRLSREQGVKVKLKELIHTETEQKMVCSRFACDDACGVRLSSTKKKWLLFE